MKTKNYILSNCTGLPRNLRAMWSIHRTNVWRIVWEANSVRPEPLWLGVTDVYLYIIEQVHLALSRDSRTGWAIPVGFLSVWRAIPTPSHLIPYPRAPTHIRRQPTCSIGHPAVGAFHSERPHAP